MDNWKGTKGKWVLDPYNATLVCSTNSDTGQIAECRSPDVECNHIAYVSDGTHWEENEEVAKANAQLIATAPELLKALQGLLSIIGNSEGVHGLSSSKHLSFWEKFKEVEIAEKAVSKALGHLK